MGAPRFRSREPLYLTEPALSRTKGQNLIVIDYFYPLKIT